VTHQPDESVPDLSKKSPALIGMLVVAGGLLVLGGGFVLYWSRTSPPDPDQVCRGLDDRMSDAEAAIDAIRDSYPDDQAPPPRGGLIDLLSKEPVADSPENFCGNMLYVWEHRLDRDPYGDLVRCVDRASSPQAIVDCRRKIEGI
jgi:hypothetical protein